MPSGLMLGIPRRQIGAEKPLVNCGIRERDCKNRRFKEEKKRPLACEKR